MKCFVVAEMENSTSGNGRWSEEFQTAAGSCGQRVRFVGFLKLVILMHFKPTQLNINEFWWQR